MYICYGEPRTLKAKYFIHILDYFFINMKIYKNKSENIRNIINIF